MKLQLQWYLTFISWLKGGFQIRFVRKTCRVFKSNRIGYEGHGTGCSILVGQTDAENRIRFPNFVTDIDLDLNRNIIMDSDCGSDIIEFGFCRIHQSMLDIFCRKLTTSAIDWPISNDKIRN